MIYLILKSPVAVALASEPHPELVEVASSKGTPLFGFYLHPGDILEFANGHFHMKDASDWHWNEFDCEKMISADTGRHALETAEFFTAHSLAEADSLSARIKEESLALCA